jgi:hypothetical protein
MKDMFHWMLRKRMGKVLVSVLLILNKTEY